MITVRRAVYDDIPGIMQFIDKHWKKGHILARDRSFFDWQYVDEKGVNVYIGIDDKEKIIYGMIGFIKYNQGNNPDISGGLWKTIKSPNPLLGMDISDFMMRDLNVRFSCSAGMSSKAKKVYQLQGMIPVSMNHYYRLGAHDEYKIAKVQDLTIPEVQDWGYRLNKINDLEEMKLLISDNTLFKNMLSKDYEYLRKRYFEHPIYKYEIWGITHPREKADSVLITREEQLNNKKCCKIIDFYGDVEKLGKIAFALDLLIAERGYEFVDVYSYGIPAEVYEKGGFCE